jgi:hypothetical protein
MADLFLKMKLEYLDRHNEVAPQSTCIKVVTTPRPPPPVDPLSDLINLDILNDDKKDLLKNNANTWSPNKKLIHNVLPKVKKYVHKPVKDPLECGLDCRCSNAKTLDGTKFVLYGALPSSGNPCYRTTRKSKWDLNIQQFTENNNGTSPPNEKTYQQQQRSSINKRRKIDKIKKSYNFDNRFYQYTCMQPFTELEYSLSIDLDTLVGDLYVQPKDDDSIDNAFVQVGNDPLIKNYVGCDGSWPMTTSGPKSNEMDSINLSNLYNILGSFSSKEEQEDCDLVMKQARRRVIKRRRNGINVYHNEDLLVGASLAIASKLTSFFFKYFQCFLFL